MNLRALFVAAVVALGPAVSRGQSPIQWQGNARAAIDQAAEQGMPLVFWVTEKADLLDDDSLRDAQEEAFRDPVVVALAQKRFVPVRVSRNSRVLEESAKLGLPTLHGLYIAIVSPDGKLVEQINPGEVADAGALANRLLAGLHKYLDGLYAQKLKPVITSPESPKQDVRRAVQMVWRLGIVSADKDCAALLNRADLTPAERGRLMSMLASIATAPCVNALLDRAGNGDKDAMASLGRAEVGALETLLKAMPENASPTARQLAAYKAACRVARMAGEKPDAFWAKASDEQRAKEVATLKDRAGPVLEYWTENVGKWR